MTKGNFDFVVIGGGVVGTTIAAGLAEKGRRVALVERGGPTISEQVQAKPVVRCSHRWHQGCIEARNHVLGGNGHYWGGGLMRPPRLGLKDCLGITDPFSGDSESLEPNFRYIEEQLGVLSPPRREVLSTTLAMGSEWGQVAEICILPGKARNTARRQLEKLCANPACEILTGADVEAFCIGHTSSRGRRVEAISVRHESELRELAGCAFVIATGAIDTNLLVLAHSREFQLDTSGSGLGTRLHDHLSVPIATVRLSGSSELRRLLAPCFRNGLVIGRHFELQCETGWGAQGFLHFTFQFDEVSPYREIKQLMLLRQQGASLSRLAAAALPLTALAPEMMKIAFDRFVKDRLHLSDNLRICATLDFETFPHPANALRLCGDGAELAWRIMSEDEASYRELLKKANRLTAELATRFSMAVEPLADFSNEEKASAHLHKSATDSFHLGGGVAAGVDDNSALDQNLRLRGLENVYAVSSAVLRRPSVVNPTHTLLALASRFVNCQSQEV